MVYYIQFTYMTDYIDSFLYVKPSLHLQDEVDLIIVDDFFYVFLDSVCQYFIEYFCIYVHELEWSVILFLGCVSVLF